jgi:hypothetical protein
LGQQALVPELRPNKTRVRNDSSQAPGGAVWRSARLMSPFWRNLILQVWGGDSLECPCCHGMEKMMQPMPRREEVEFFLRLNAL